MNVFFHQVEHSQPPLQMENQPHTCLCDTQGEIFIDRIRHYNDGSRICCIKQQYSINPAPIINLLIFQLHIPGASNELRRLINSASDRTALLNISLDGISLIGYAVQTTCGYKDAYPGLEILLNACDAEGITRSLINKVDRYGKTPLYNACWFNNTASANRDMFDIIQLLVKHGADPYYRSDAVNWSPYDLMCKYVPELAAKYAISEKPCEEP